MFHPQRKPISPSQSFLKKKTNESYFSQSKGRNTPSPASEKNASNHFHSKGRGSPLPVLKMNTSHLPQKSPSPRTPTINSPVPDKKLSPRVDTKKLTPSVVSELEPCPRLGRTFSSSSFTSKQRQGFLPSSKGTQRQPVAAGAANNKKIEIPETKKPSANIKKIVIPAKSLPISPKVHQIDLNQELRERLVKLEELIYNLTQPNIQNKNITLPVAPVEIEYKNIAQQQNGEDFIRAAASGDLDKVEAFLKIGVNINAVDNQGNTAIFHSIFNNHTVVTLSLLRKHPDFDIRNKEGKTILHKACEENNLDLVKKILDIFPTDDCEAKTLLSALEMKTTKEIKRKIANKILFQAAKQNNLVLAEKALANGAGVMAQDGHRKTALEKACYFKSMEVITILLRHISLRDEKNQQTPFDINSDEDIEKKVTSCAAAVIQQHYRRFFYLSEKTLRKKYVPVIHDFTEQAKDDNVIKLAGFFKKKQFFPAAIMMQRHKEEMQNLYLSSSFSASTSLSVKSENQEEQKTTLKLSRS
jgi:ankyrin repeat protein